LRLAKKSKKDVLLAAQMLRILSARLREQNIHGASVDSLRVPTEGQVVHLIAAASCARTRDRPVQHGNGLIVSFGRSAAERAGKALKERFPHCKPAANPQYLSNCVRKYLPLQAPCIYMYMYKHLYMPRKAIAHSTKSIVDIHFGNVSPMRTALIIRAAT
jgi:hypothetical protein